MPGPPLSPVLAQQAVDAVAKCDGNLMAAANMLGLPRATLQNRIAAAMRQGIVAGVKPPPPKPDPLPGADEQKLRDKVFELQTQLQSFRANELTDRWVRNKIIGLNDAMEQVVTPSWSVRPLKGQHNPGAPSVLWSDWHAGEVIDPGQINGRNEFDMEIMQARVRMLVERTIHLLRHDVVNPNYPGITVNLGGDMLSGDIHDELKETNEEPTLKVLMALVGILKWALVTLADEFGAVQLHCVSGNHGRMTHKPRAKNRSYTNLDWLTYTFLAKLLEADTRISFNIPTSNEAYYAIFGHRYCLVHGDDWRGGDGMIGHFGPVLRGSRKKQAANSPIGLGFDTLMHGHFHTYFPTQSIIGNGSLCGYNEYARLLGANFEPAQQALWLTHPEHGITRQMPVLLAPWPDRKQQGTESWAA